MLDPQVVTSIEAKIQRYNKYSKNLLIFSLTLIGFSAYDYVHHLKAALFVYMAGMSVLGISLFFNYLADKLDEKLFNMRLDNTFDNIGRMYREASELHQKRIDADVFNVLGRINASPPKNNKRRRGLTDFWK